MRISHPNVGGAPNLNGTKFKRLRVHGGLPTDLVSAVVACAEFRRKQSLASTDSIARLALFSAGSNMKLLETAALKGSVTPEERLESFGNQPLSELSADFHRAIMAELRVANKALIVALCDPVTKKLDADRVASMKWESELQPVPRSVLERVWSTVSGQRLDPTLGVGVLALEIEIHRLVDGGHLTADFQHSFLDGVPEKVYPPTASALFLEDWPEPGPEGPGGHAQVATSTLRLFAVAAFEILHSLENGVSSRSEPEELIVGKRDSTGGSQSARTDAARYGLVRVLVAWFTRLFSVK